VIPRMWGSSCRHWPADLARGDDHELQPKFIPCIFELDDDGIRTLPERIEYHCCNLYHTASIMFAPRFQSFFRPASNRASQCPRQRRAAIPKSSMSRPIQQQRHQSTRSAAAAGKSLFKEYPYSVTAAFALSVDFFS
jgi:hypothetical protein